MTHPSRFIRLFIAAALIATLPVVATPAAADMRPSVRARAERVHDRRELRRDWGKSIRVHRVIRHDARHHRALRQRLQARRQWRRDLRERREIRREWRQYRREHRR